MAKVKAQTIGGTEHKIWNVWVNMATLKYSKEGGCLNNTLTDGPNIFEYIIRAITTRKDRILSQKTER